MEKRVGQQKTFGFTREIKSTSASKIDANVNRSQDDDDDGVSILSVDDHSPVHSVSFNLKHIQNKIRLSYLSFLRTF